jgi:hypothetical protein
VTEETKNRDLRGEDLSKGPTPQTRHPEGGGDDVTDTTEGPTPETRKADRAAEVDKEGEATASGQPKADAGTRAQHKTEQI